MVTIYENVSSELTFSLHNQNVRLDFDDLNDSVALEFGDTRQCATLTTVAALLWTR